MTRRWLLLTWGFGALLHGETHVLVLAGNTNRPRYENISRLAYEVGTRRGYDVDVAAGDGSWDFARRGDMHPAATVEQVAARLQAIGRSLKPGDDVVLFVTDHGGDGTGGDDPLDTTVVLSPVRRPTSKDWQKFISRLPVPQVSALTPERSRFQLLGATQGLSSLPQHAFGQLSAAERERVLGAAAQGGFQGPLRSLFGAGQPSGGDASVLDVLDDAAQGDHGPSPQMTHRELMELIRAHIPAANTVRMVGIHCFSGGLHGISHELPNACSAASTDFRNVNTSTQDHSLYGKGFWEELRKPTHDLNRDGKTSLFEAHLAGFELDTLNQGRAQLSSIAYVDSVLGIGAYRPTEPAPPAQLQEGAGGWIFEKILGRRPKVPGAAPRAEPSAEPAPENELRIMGGALRFLQQSARAGRILNRPPEDHDGVNPLRPEAEDPATANVENLLEALRTRLTALQRQSRRQSGEVGSLAITGEEGSLLPAPFLEAVDQKLTLWEARQKEINRSLEKLHTQYESLQERWAKLSEEEKDAQWEEFQALFQKIEAQVREGLLPQLFRFGTLLSDFERVERFVALATPEQKATFRRLVECELLPL